MPTTPLRKFQTESARIKSLYVSTQYSYGQTAGDLTRKIESKEVNASKPFKLSPKHDEPDSAHENAYVVLRRFKNQFPKYLRKTLLVRLISSLEVFFLDVVREVFLARRDLFHTDSKRLEFSYGELLSVGSVTDLWSKVINRDIRNLQNQGFKEIVKFYKGRLGIDFAGCEIPMAKLEEFHDRRHILVHRLGVVDDEYRHRYKTDEKTLTVTHEYLFGCMAELSRLTSWLYERATKKMAEAPGFARTPPEFLIRLTVEVASGEVPRFLFPGFDFHVGEKIQRLGDLLVSRTTEAGTHIMTIGGETSAVRTYLKLLKSAEAQGIIAVRQRSLLRDEIGLRLKWKQSDDLLRQIWERLPTSPWPRHIHKTIAKDFGLSNSQAAVAIGLFMQRDSR